MIDLDEFFSDFTEEEYVRLTEEHFKEIGEYCKDNISDKYADVVKPLTNENINENLREFFDRGCEYSGTQEQINDWTQEVIKEFDPKSTSYFNDCMITNYDGSEVLGSLDDFVDMFWDKAIEGILNVIATEK